MLLINFLLLLGLGIIVMSTVMMDLVFIPPADSALSPQVAATKMERHKCTFYSAIH